MDRTYGITKDWDPFGSGSSRIDPLTNYSVLGEQVNPIIKKTVCYGADSKYLNTYIAYLKEYSTNDYFNMSYVNSVYDTAKLNYSPVYKPTIRELVDKSINFNIYDSNYNISNYLFNIKENIQSIK